MLYSYVIQFYKIKLLSFPFHRRGNWGIQKAHGCTAQERQGSSLDPSDSKACTQLLQSSTENSSVPIIQPVSSHTTSSCTAWTNPVLSCMNTFALSFPSPRNSFPSSLNTRILPTFKTSSITMSSRTQHKPFRHNETFQWTIWHIDTKIDLDFRKAKFKSSLWHLLCMWLTFSKLSSF